VSEKLPSRQEALSFLNRNGCSAKVIKHCEAVAACAVEIARKLREKGLNIDVDLVEIGALLHDVGRSRTHSVNHAVVGAEIAKKAGMPEKVVNIIKRHVGGGITQEEAENLGWPKDVYTPQTLEEKIVCYADKLTGDAKQIPIEWTMTQLSKEHKNGAAERVKKLHEEIRSLLGETA